MSLKFMDLSFVFVYQIYIYKHTDCFNVYNFIQN